MRGSKMLALMIAMGSACGGSPSPGPSSPPVTTPDQPMSGDTTPVEEAKPAPPPTPQKSMAEKIDDSMKTLVTGWNEHDATKIAAAYSDKAVMKFAGMPDVTGRAAIQGMATEQLKVFPDFKVALTRVVRKDPTAIVEWVVTGTNTGASEVLKVKATGRSIGLHGVDVVTFDDHGLIQEDRRYSDAPTQMAQLDPKSKKGTFRPVATLPTGEPTTIVSAGSDDEAGNLATMKGLYAAIETHKVAAALAPLDANIMGEDYTQPAAMKGTKAAKAYMTAIFKAIPDITQDIAVQIAAGDLVITEGYMHGTFKGRMGPMKPTNKPIGMHFVDIARVKDGKVVEITSYGNSAEMMAPAAK